MAKMVTVIKQDPQGNEIWRWKGELLKRSEKFLLIKAIFNGPEGSASPLPFKPGDPIYEYYYADRWYNVFELHDQENGAIKGWYCNLSLPAEISEDEIRFRDLALDLVVLPDGSQEELDWHEFEELDLSEEVRLEALKAWDLLRLGFEPPKK